MPSTAPACVPVTFTEPLSDRAGPLSLSLAAFGAIAAGPVIGVQYDFDRANGDGYKGNHEAKLSVAQDTKLGTFDAGLIGARFRGSVASDDANGFEVGYSNGFAYGQFGLKGRLGYGRMNQIDPNGGGFTGNTNYWSAGVEGAMPVSTAVNAFVGYRHRNGGDNITTQNRYLLGVDYAVTKSIALRGAFAHTRQGVHVFNGLQAGASYSF